jgi:hypothetical protein
MRLRVVSILIALSCATSLIVLTDATAAPKKPVAKQVAVKKLDLLTTAKDVEGLVANGKTLFTYSNTVGSNSNVVVTGLDATGLQLWQKTIDSGADDIALEATGDSAGNLWIAGASAPVVAVETSTVQTLPDNPDGVIVEPNSPLRGDATLLTLWKISTAGELLATYTIPEYGPPLVNSISVNASGISIVGQLIDKPFLISATPLGVFGKLITIGTSKTQINSVERNADGSVDLFGSSAETLGGKKLIGIRDGVLIKVAKTGNIATVVRSSAPKGDRSWINSDSTLALTGYVKSGKTIESAFTKFTSAFAPTWTIRFPSRGTSAVASSPGLTYASIGSNSPVVGVSGWRPTISQLLLLVLDSKGALTAAYSAAELANPISLSYSKEIGLYGLGKMSDGSISIFHLATR